MFILQIVFFREQKTFSAITDHYGAIFGATWPVFEPKQDIDSNNVPIKFEEKNNEEM